MNDITLVITVTPSYLLGYCTILYCIFTFGIFIVFDIKVNKSLTMIYITYNIKHLMEQKKILNKVLKLKFKYYYIKN